MNLLRVPRRFLLAVTCFALALAGCASNTSVSQLAVTRAPSATVRRLSLRVDETANNDRGEATTLRNGLRRELGGAGYELVEGGNVLLATIVRKDRGSSLVNTQGLGMGRDDVSVVVQLKDPAGALLVSFQVDGAALDKRYTDLHEVLAEDVPRAIRDQLRAVSR